MINAALAVLLVFIYAAISFLGFIYWINAIGATVEKQNIK